jgi:hypothetical protein
MLISSGASYTMHGREFVADVLICLKRVNQMLDIDLKRLEAWILYTDKC